MKPAPLQLLDYWANSLRMEACPEFDSGSETQLDFESITVHHGVKQIESPDPETNGTRWIVGLSIEQAPCESANIPYTFAVSLQGVVLALPGGPTGERLERAIKANGPAMLFGAAREMIRAATGRGPHSAVIIPSTNFLPAAPPPAEEREPAATKKKAKKQSSAKKAPHKAD